MKFIKTILKNFKILFRMKTSLIAIILGPLLVILLIGLAFNSSTSFDVIVGYHAADKSTLTSDFVGVLNNSYSLKQFASKEDCTNELKQGLLNICIDFPEHFVVENKKSNNITFVVDKGRVNLVYAVIESVSEKVGIKTGELSKGFAETVTDTLSNTANTIDKNLGALIKVKKAVSDSSDDAEIISKNLGSMDLDMVSVSVNFNGDADNLLEKTKKLNDEIQTTADAGLSLIEDIRAQNQSQNISATLSTMETNFQSLKLEGTNRYKNANKTANSLKEKINKASEGLDSIQTKLTAAKALTAENQQRITILRTGLGSILTNIEDIKQSLEEASQKISNIKITSSEQIVNPINTNIETVSSDTNQLVILFPYVVLLIIMFVGLLLASTLVIIEKKNKASFRVFTTPTRDEFYIVTTFVTAFIIVALQMIIILVLANYFITNIITANLLINIIILFLGTSLFILLGMAIGYLVNSQQGSNMLSISLGAIFLFISNMVLPLESVSKYLKNLAQYNPYVLTSESLRKSILFGASFNTIGREFLILVTYSIIILILIILFQKLSKNMYFRHIPHLRAKKREGKIIQFMINGSAIHTEKDFIKNIHSLTEKEYTQFVKKSKSAKRFISQRMDKPLLAHQLKKLSKKDLLYSIAHANKKIIESLGTEKETKLKGRSKNKKK